MLQLLETQTFGIDGERATKRKLEVVEKDLRRALNAIKALPRPEYQRYVVTVAAITLQLTEQECEEAFG